MGFRRNVILRIMMKDASVERIHTDTAVTLLVPHKSIATPPTTINCCLEFHFQGYRFLNYTYKISFVD